MNCEYRDCESEVYAKGVCYTHYFAEHRFRGKKDKMDDFWEFVKKELNIA